ncbi:HAMP domain-containing sensor histidine kinase [Streptosporangium sp. NPDC023615]|uniref:sensor histidine kinase n=1 Tax=Streptosporangium sp. NPDC023615 TaxID=3154794 RepID=UPI003446C1F0
MTSRLSVRLRATLAATAIVAVALGVAAAVLVGVLNGSLTRSAAGEAARRAGATADVLTAGAARDGLVVSGTTRSGEPAVLDPDVKIFARTVSPDRALSTRAPDGAPAPGRGPGAPRTRAGERTGAPHARTGQDTGPSHAKARTVTTFVESATPAGTDEMTRWAPGESFTLATVPVDTADGVVVVQARASLEAADDALRSLRGLLVPGIPALLLLVAVLTWLAVGRALAPVSAIRAEMADITASDLHRRVPVPRARDEIARLAETMNRTLDRLEVAVGRHRRFVADAAHELRSPLAVLRTRLELAPPGPPADEALTDVERIQALTSDLLLLARLDAGEPARTEEVDVGQVTAEEAARARPRPEVEVRMEVAADAVVLGSAGQLRRLVANLVDNAVRHADATVVVRLTADGDEVVLDVRDDGPGIPAEHHEAIFDRFTRLDEARDRDAGGSGLGLAIARDIAVRHGGVLRVVAGPPGAWLQARFPATGPGLSRRREPPSSPAAGPSAGDARAGRAIVPPA